MNIFQIPRFDSFFIFRRVINLKNEADKIILYLPNKIPIDKQLLNIGFAQATIAFSRTFSSSFPQASLHTEKYRWVFFEPEPNYWMVFLIKNASNTQAKESKKNEKFKYEFTNDNCLFQALRKGYYMFSLFYHSFNHLITNYSLEELRNKVNQFFSFFIPTVDFIQTSLKKRLLSLFQGIRYYPLDKNMFLKVYCFVNMIESSFSKIKHSIFLYGSNLIWSSLNLSDTNSLYNFLCGYINPKPAVENEYLVGIEEFFIGKTASPQLPQPKNYFNWSLEDISKLPQNPDLFNYPELVFHITQTIAKARSNFSDFITGPKLDSKKNFFLPKIFVGNEEKKQHVLLIYKANKVIFCLLVEPDEKLQTMSFYNQMKKRIETEIETIVNNLFKSEHILQISSQNELLYKFLYFNEMNLALKETLSMCKEFELRHQFLMYLSSIVDSFYNSERLFINQEKRYFQLKNIEQQTKAQNQENNKDPIENNLDSQKQTQTEKYVNLDQNLIEVTTNINNSLWIVMKRAGSRLILMLVENQNLNISNISKEVDKLNAEFFRTIYLN
ncbi:hypothetical protein M0811_08938 [Anaeramoeba ignava]|uniref:CCZ1/INTU/HSP4 first Longin domain-containing protein n=1 Tax=Anaeramoeba ignava TaxID=1746090 RepID=A0A9Q0RAN2_ANAIG|nr:hypothetical protein M0811_08938 [Anaeramoeba ignava]